MRILPSRSTTAYLVAVLVLPLGCERAQFEKIPIDGSGGLGGSPGDAADAARDCPPPSKCATLPSGGAPCDVVCQTGSCNWCSEKCGIDNAGSIACVPRVEPSQTRKVEETCSSSSGATSQSDTCEEGTICLNSGGVGESIYNCFFLCRGAGHDVDCPGTQCAPRTLGISRAWVCDPKYAECNPSVPGSCCNPLANPGDPNDECAKNGGYCYLVSGASSGNSRTVCEYGAGALPPKASCSYAGECAFKATCAPQLGGGQCRRICNTDNPCDQDAACNYGSTGAQYGFCPP